MKSELAQYREAGYNPVRRDPNYPNNIRAAQARIAAQNGTAPGQTSYGPSGDGSSQSGAPSK